MTKSNRSAMDLEFEQERRDRVSRGAVILGWLIVCLGPLFGILDLLLKPSHLIPEYFAIRIGASLFAVVLLMVGFKIKVVSPMVLAIAQSVAVGCGIATMCHLDQGVYDPYYAGINLIYIATALMLPLNFREGFACFGITQTYYIFPFILNWQNTPQYTSSFLSNNYFMASTILITSVSFYFQNVWHRNDLANRKLLEAKQEELNLANRELEGRFSESTADLSKKNEELKQSQNQLIQASKLSALGTMLAGVTHELNNQILPILGYVELMEMNETDPEKKKNLKIIKESALHTKSIVSEMLAFSRPSKGEILPINLTQTANRVLKLLAREFVRNCVSCESEIPNADVWITGNQKQLEQVFLNIIKNGMEALEGRENKKMKVYMTFDDKEAVLHIQDNGTGMTEETKVKIFDPFYTTKEVGKGTGLGMSVSYGIINSHQGKISIDSTLGQGTTFHLHFPVISERERMVVESANSIDQAILNFQGFKDLKILTVDDDPKVQSLMVQFFKGMGLSGVEVATNVPDALKLLKTNTYDLIVSDLRMAPLTGIQFYEKIKQEYPQMKSKFMIATGDTFDPVFQTFLKETELPWIAKPFEMKKLLEMVIKQIFGAETKARVKQKA